MLIQKQGMDGLFCNSYESSCFICWLKLIRCFGEIYCVDFKYKTLGSVKKYVHNKIAFSYFKGENI